MPIAAAGRHATANPAREIGNHSG